MKDEKIVNLLSMAQRAGRVASGDTAVREAFEKKKARFLLLAKDAADETKKLYTGFAEKAGIPVCEAMDKESLGNAIGKEQRAAAVLLDQGFSDALKKRLESNQ
jgi:ribosomal protein L7Ae-like RNA K-turn-binding protein